MILNRDRVNESVEVNNKCDMSSICIIYACLIIPETYKHDKKKPILVEIGEKSKCEAPLKSFINGTVEKENFHLNEQNKEKSYTLGPYTYSFLYWSISKQLGITVSSVDASTNGHMRIIYKFLEEFLSIYTLSNDRIKLETLLVKYNNQPIERHDPLKVIELDLEETKGVLHQSLHNMFDRGQNLDQIEENAYELEFKTKELSHNANTVKKMAWWNRLKFRICACSTCITLCIIIITIIIVLLYVFLRSV